MPRKRSDGSHETRADTPSSEFSKGSDGPSSPDSLSSTEGAASSESDADQPRPSAKRPITIALREQMLSQHPVVGGHYTIPTPMLIQAHEEARDRVWSKRTGAVFYGKTRTGKSTCAKTVRGYLQEEFPQIYITMASGRRSLRPKEGKMAQLILEGSGHVLAKRTDPDLLLRNVILDIQMNVANLGGQQYVLILDEVNLCNEFDLTSLLEIHNMLAMREITMTTISFGQPDVLNLINSLIATEQEQIIARFFRKPVPFYGCTSEETLKDVLEKLDNETEWPEGSGWTFTYFFFPEAYKTGFRMSHFAGAIWLALVNATEVQPFGFTMETISLLVKGIYVATRGADRAGMVLCEEAIATALKATDI